MTFSDKHIFIIAEAGVNHNGSMETARRMIDAACEAGVDAIKFQTFRSEKLVSRTAQKADYQKRNTHSDDSQLSMLKKLELRFDQFALSAKFFETFGELDADIGNAGAQLFRRGDVMSSWIDVDLDPIDQ